MNADAHPAIVPRVEWEAANAARTQATARNPTLAPALLAGIIRCAGCRYVMPRSAMRKVGKARYGCAGRHARGVCEHRTRISIAVIEPYIESMFLSRLAGDEVEAVGEPNSADLDEATRALEAADAELEAYRDETLVSLVGRESFQAGISKRATVVEQARQRVLELRGVSGAAPITRSLLAEWPTMDVVAKHAILVSAIDAVMVRPASAGGLDDRVRVLWRGEAPDDLPRRGRPQPVVPFVFA